MDQDMKDKDGPAGNPASICFYVIDRNLPKIRPARQRD